MVEKALKSFINGSTYLKQRKKKKIRLSTKKLPSISRVKEAPANSSPYFERRKKFDLPAMFFKRRNLILTLSKCYGWNEIAKNHFVPGY